MSRMDTLFDIFTGIAAHPRAQLDACLARGQSAVGCFPYYAPEELVSAAGMLPFGVWGMNGTPAAAAKEYFPSFYCSLAQMNLELGLTGALRGLSAVIVTSMCDTLRPLGQNFRVGVPDIPFIFIAHPQNRRPEYGVRFLMRQYAVIRDKLAAVAGRDISDDDIRRATIVHNASRAERREFTRLAGLHPGVVSPTRRSAVLKSAHFIEKAAHTELLRELNGLLRALPAESFLGVRVVTTGIMADSPGLLAAFERYGIAVAADDVAHESRALLVDAPYDPDPLRALALQFAAQDCDPLLYDPELTKRPAHVVRLVRDSGAQGVVVLMTQFCDPEELEYPSLKAALNEAGIPHIMLGYDQQMTDFGQAATQLEAFSEMIGVSAVRV